MPTPNEVTHGDIMLQIGELKGQVQTLITMASQKHEEMANAFLRISALEKCAADRPALAAVEARVGVLERDVAKWAGIAMACSLIVPLAITAAKPILHFGEPSQSAAPHITAMKR